MTALDSLSRWLLQGADAMADGVREEARRVLDVLVERGDLSPEEADRIEAGVVEAAGSRRRWLDEHLLAPLGRAMRGAAAPGRDEAVAARLEAIESRLVRLERMLGERLLAERPRDGS